MFYPVAWFLFGALKNHVAPTHPESLCGRGRLERAPQLYSLLS